MAHHADAKRMLDDRGYSGHLVRGQPPHLLFEGAVRNRITESCVIYSASKLGLKVMLTEY